MDLRKLSREKKETLYIRKMTALQKHWGNPIDNDWEYIKEWPDDGLEEEIRKTIGQLRFEKPFVYIRKFFFFIILVFVLLGIIGLLSFGIKQIF